MTKMKKIYYIMAAAAVLGVAGCDDDDDVFSESSSERMENYLDNVESVIGAHSGGWILEQFVGDDAEYGGYVYALRFADNQCTVTDEDGTTSTSYWRFKKDNGPVLSFDTFNEALHALSTPNGSMYEGYHADYEFAIDSCAADIIVLRGRKTDNTCYLRAVDDAEAYIAAVATVRESFYQSVGTGSVDGEAVEVLVDHDYRHIEIATESETAYAAFCYTNTGIRLYDSEVGSELTYANSGLTGDGVSIVLTLPEGYSKFEDFAGKYTLISASGNYSVTLEADGDVYKLKGLASGFDVTLTYDKTDGRLVFAPQVVYSCDDYEIMLCAFSYNDGYISGSDDVTFEYFRFEDESKGVDGYISFFNEVGGVEFDSWMLFGVDENGLSREVLVAFLREHTDYLIGGRYHYVLQPQILNKVTN